MKFSRLQIATVVVLSLLTLCGAVAIRMWSDVSAMKAIFSCSESAEGQAVAPNKKYIAQVFIRNCGVTTHYVTHVNLRGADDKFSADENGVVNSGEVVSVEGDPKVHLTWVQDAELDVQVSSEAALSSVNNAQIWGAVRVHVRN